MVYIGFTALVINLLVSVVGTIVLRGATWTAGEDQTRPGGLPRPTSATQGVEEELTPDTPAHA